MQTGPKHMICDNFHSYEKMREKTWNPTNSKNKYISKLKVTENQSCGQECEAEQTRCLEYFLYVTDPSHLHNRSLYYYISAEHIHQHNIDFMSICNTQHWLTHLDSWSAMKGNRDAHLSYQLSSRCIFTSILGWLFCEHLAFHSYIAFHMTNSCSYIEGFKWWISWNSITMMFHGTFNHQWVLRHIILGVLG